MLILKSGANGPSGANGDSCAKAWSLNKNFEDAGPEGGEGSEWESSGGRGRCLLGLLGLSAQLGSGTPRSAQPGTGTPPGNTGRQAYKGLPSR